MSLIPYLDEPVDAAGREHSPVVLIPHQRRHRRRVGGEALECVDGVVGVEAEDGARVCPEEQQVPPEGVEGEARPSALGQKDSSWIFLSP